MIPSSLIRRIARFVTVALAVFAFGTAPGHAAAPLMTAAALAELNQALIDAAAQGQVDSVTLDVYRGADVNTVDRYRRTPLTACASGEGPELARLHIAKMLVGYGADVNQHSVFQPTPLLVAIDHSQTLIARYLLDNGADPASFDALGACALTHAARTGQIALIAALIAKGADVRSTDHNGRTPLMWASGRPTSIPDYTSVDEVSPSEAGYTVLRYVRNRVTDLPGGADVIRALIAANAQVDAVDNEDNTALMIAAGAGKTEVVRALVDAHADWKRRNDQSDTALMCAELGGYHDTVTYLKAVGGAKDPVYLALERRIEGTRESRDKDIEGICARDLSPPQSNKPGLTIRVYAESEFVGENETPVLHYVLQNRTNSPLSVLSPQAVSPDTQSPIKAGWSITEVDKSRSAHPQKPALPLALPKGGAIAALDKIAIVIVPANGSIDIPITANLPPIPNRSLSVTGIYRAAFFYDSDPHNLPYATDDVHDAANTTVPCHLVSNEITIICE